MLLKGLDTNSGSFLSSRNTVSILYLAHFSCIKLIIEFYNLWFGDHTSIGECRKTGNSDFKKHEKCMIRILIKYSNIFPMFPRSMFFWVHSEDEIYSPESNIGD